MFWRMVAAGLAISGVHCLLIGALPVYLDDAGTRPWLIGTVVGAYAVTMGLMRLLGAVLLDRLPHVLLFVIACSSLALAFAGYALLPVGPALLVPRLLHGAGYGLFVIVAYAWIARHSERDDAGRRLGIFGAATGVAIVVMPPIGLAVLESWGATVLFALGALVAVAALALRPRRESPLAPPSGADDNAPLWIPMAILFCCAATTGLLEAFIPMISLTRAVDNLLVVYAFFGAALACGRLLGGSASDRFGRLGVTLAGCLAVALTTGAFSTVAGTWGVAANAFCYGLGVGAAVTATLAYVSDRAASHQQGRALGLAILAYDLGLAAGAGVAGAFAEASVATLPWLGASFGCAGLVLALARQRADAASTSSASVSAAAAREVDGS